MVWWHSLVELRRCAQRCCKLCSITSANIEHKYHHRLKDLEDWAVILPANFLGEPEADSLFLRISLPDKDPRPHPEVFDTTKALMYDYVAIDVSLRPVSGQLR